MLTACGSSAEDVLVVSESSETSQTESANSAEQSVSVDDELSLVDFKTRCIVDRISDSGNLWFTVELTNELDDDRRFTVHVMRSMRASSRPSTHSTRWRLSPTNVDVMSRLSKALKSEQSACGVARFTNLKPNSATASRLGIRPR